MREKILKMTRAFNDNIVIKVVMIITGQNKVQ